MIDWIDVDKKLIDKHIHENFDYWLANAWLYIKLISKDDDDYFDQHIYMIYKIIQEEREKYYWWAILIKEEPKSETIKDKITQKVMWFMWKEQPKLLHEIEAILKEYWSELYTEIKDIKKIDEQELLQLATKYMLKFYDISPFPQDNWRIARMIANYIMMKLFHYPIKFCASEKDKLFAFLEEYKNTGDQKKMQDFLGEQYKQTMAVMDCNLNN